MFHPKHFSDGLKNNKTILKPLLKFTPVASHLSPQIFHFALQFEVIQRLLSTSHIPVWKRSPYERDCYLGGIPRIPNHRAPNHQFTISWFLETKQETLAPLKAVIIPGKANRCISIHCQKRLTLLQTGTASKTHTFSKKKNAQTIQFSPWIPRKAHHGESSNNPSNGRCYQNEAIQVL